MARFLFLITSLLAIEPWSCHAATPAAQLYWHAALPNTPIPGAIRDHLQPRRTVGKPSAGVRSQMINYQCGFAATATEIADNPNFALFFLPADLRPGARKSLQFVKTSGAAPFLPREAADSIPFSSADVPEILRRFAIEPNSTYAAGVERAIQQCEQPAGNRETKYCATSLESMVEFVMSSFGTREIRAVSTAVDGEGSPKQNYTVEPPGLQRIGGSKSMACHGLNYMYAVFYCHTAAAVEAYRVSMVGEDGTRAEAFAVCHRDTSGWNPKHVVFRLLGVAPGSPVCHFMPQDHVVWITK